MISKLQYIKFHIFYNFSSPYNQLVIWCYCISSWCIRVISWFEWQKCM